MILAVDVGNTNIVVGCVELDKNLFTERISTDASKTGFEYAMIFKSVFELHSIDKADIEGAIISNVVPSLQSSISEAVTKLIGKKPLVVGPGLKTGLNIKLDDPRSVGSDLIATAVAGIKEYGAPLLIIDMGTATTISVIDKNGAYVGGMISPGIGISMNALATNTALLPGVSLEGSFRAVGRSTAECMKSGIVLGCASMLDGMIDRMQEEMGYEACIVATGGWAKNLIPLCKHSIKVDEDLLIKGLKTLFDKNK